MWAGWSPNVPDRVQCARLSPAAKPTTSVSLQRFLPLKLKAITCQRTGDLHKKGQRSFPIGAWALDLPELWWDIRTRQRKNDIRGVKCQVLHLKRDLERIFYLTRFLFSPVCGPGWCQCLQSNNNTRRREISIFGHEGACSLKAQRQRWMFCIFWQIHLAHGVDLLGFWDSTRKHRF